MIYYTYVDRIKRWQRHAKHHGLANQIYRSATYRFKISLLNSGTLFRTNNKRFLEEKDRLVDILERHKYINNIYRYKNERIFSGNVYSSLINFNVLMEAAFNDLFKEMPDIIFCHDFQTLYAGAMLKSRHPEGLFIFDLVEYPKFSERTQFYKMKLEDGITEALIEDAMRRCIKSYDAVFTGNFGQDEKIKQICGDLETRVVLNGRMYEEPKVDKSIRSFCGVDDDDILIICPNSAFRGGGLREMIQALAELGDRYHLAVQGNISRDYALEVDALVEELCVKDRFHKLPFVDPANLTSWMSGADVAAICSDTSLENYKSALPNRIFEAVAARLPVIANVETAVGKFVRENGIGETYAENAAGGLAKAIRQLLKRNDLRDNLERTAKKYSWELTKPGVIRDLNGAPFHNGHCVVMAGKQISTNTRLFRFASLLVEIGYRVSVVAFDEPVDSLRATSVEYIPVGRSMVEHKIRSEHAAEQIL